MNNQPEDEMWISFSSIRSLVRNFRDDSVASRGRNETSVFVFIIVFTGIANRAIRPMLGIVDPLHTLHMPERLTANSGYDVLW